MSNLELLAVPLCPRRDDTKVQPATGEFALAWQDTQQVIAEDASLTYIVGDGTEQELIVAAGGGPIPTPAERLCEAASYVGLRKLIAGKNASAKEMYIGCVGTGQRHHHECHLAVAELARAALRSDARLAM